MADTPQPATQAQIRAKELLDKIWGDPDIGAKVRAAAKATFPDITLPDEQVAPVIAPIRAELDELRAANKKLVEDAEKRAKDEADKAAASSFEKKLADARAKFNLTDEGVAKVLARMKETGNFTDVESTAALIVSQMPAPKPTTGPSWLPQSMNLFGSQEHDEKFEKLHRNPLGYMDDELRAFVADPDGYVKETFGNAA